MSTAIFGDLTPAARPRNLSGALSVETQLFALRRRRGHVEDVIAAGNLRGWDNEPVSLEALTLQAFALSVEIADLERQSRKFDAGVLLDEAYELRHALAMSGPTSKDTAKLVRVFEHAGRRVDRRLTAYYSCESPEVRECLERAGQNARLEEVHATFLAEQADPLFGI